MQPQNEIGKLLKILSRNGVCSILLCLEKNPKRFSQLMFDARLNPGVLNRHLKSLMQLDMVKKVSDEYMLTENGKRIVEVLKQLMRIDHQTP